MENEKLIQVLVVHPSGRRVAENLQAELPGLRVQVYETHAANDVPISAWRKCDVLYTERALPLPEQAPNLNWVQFHYAGIDYILSAPLLQKPGLQVTTLSGVPALPMGEYALMMMLTQGHRLAEMRAYQEKSTWPAERFEALAPLELRKSTVGIVGYGSSGRQVARLAKAFGARIIAVKRDPKCLKDDGYCPPGSGDPEGRFIDMVFPTKRLREMLPLCDFVVVTVPLTGSTRGLLGRDELFAMKKGAYLLDISRGGVVDHEALRLALQDHLAGAALDVFPTEPLPKDSPLWHCPNVVITPHLSGYSPAYFEDAHLLFKQNLERYLSGETLLNRYDFHRGY